MAKQRYYLDTRVLTAFFFAAMPFVAFGSFIVVNQARNQLRESVGTSLEQRAVQTKLALEQYVGEQVVHLRVLAMDPDVQKALAAPARPCPRPTSRQMEQAWATGKDAKLNASLLETPARGAPQAAHGSSAPRSSRSSSSTPRAASWPPPAGAAASSTARATGSRTSRPRRAARGPRGRALRTGRDRPSTSSRSPSPCAPRRTSRLGALRALLDAADLYTVLAPVRIGRTGHAALIRSTDGLVLASDESERILKVPLPGFDALRNAVEGFPLAESGQELFGRARLHRGFWTIPEVKAKDEAGRDVVIEPSRIVGFSPIDQIPDVNWMVTVEQDRSEALAPIESVTRYLWVHFIGVFATVILLALYFSFKLERPVMQEDLHLHEEHVPAGLKKSVEELTSRKRAR